MLAGGGRLIKTHEPYRKDYKKAVFLVRDVRDVFLSCYAAGVEVGLAPLVSRGDPDSFLHSFLEGKALAMGSWQSHVGSWLDSPLAKNGNLMIVRYEDLRRNAEQVLQELLQFLGVPADIRSIRNALENNSLQQMRAKEDRARRTGEHSALVESYKGAQEDGRFVRQGAVGGWRSKLTDSQIKVIQHHAGEALAALGYEPRLVNDERPVPAASSASAI